MNVYFYETKGGKNVILLYIDSLPLEEKVDCYQVIQKLQNGRMEILKSLETRQLMGKLWEIKIHSNRIMYVIADDNNIYFVNACRKQKQKAELYELDKAIRRVKELEKIIGKKLL